MEEKFKDINIDDLHLPILNKSTSNELCVVLTIYGNHKYIEKLLLLLSTLSLYTDIDNYNIKIFTDYKLHNIVTNMLSPYIGSNNIIPLNINFLYKFMLMSHHKLKVFDNIMFIDSDMLFYSKNRVNFFKMVNSYLHNNRHDVFLFKKINVNNRIPYKTMLKRYYSGHKDRGFKSFRKMFTSIFSSKKKYINNFLFNGVWGYNGILAYNNGNEYYNDKFKSSSLDFNRAGSYCDETFTNLYWVYINKKVKSIESFSNVEVIFMLDAKYVRSTDKLKIIHPYNSGIDNIQSSSIHNYVLNKK